MNQDLFAKVIEGVCYRMRNVRYTIPDDFLSYEHYSRVVANLEWTSSPGYPYMTQGYVTNGQLFGVQEGIPGEQAKMAIWGIVQRRLKERDSDPIRMFVKPEVHKQKKLDQHMYRLISGVSVVDQIIDHMLFGALNEKLYSDWTSTPVKVGWSPLKGGWKYVPIHGMTSTDKSAWDWTVQPWLVHAIFSVRTLLCDNPTAEWKELAEFRYRELFEKPVFIFSNGLKLQQKFIGYMKSGCVNTIVDNSIGQIILDMRVCEELSLRPGILWAMGDDVLQETQPKEYFERLSQLCILKEVTPRIEFAGMQFVRGRVEPSYLPKHAYNLLHIDPQYLDGVAVSYSLLYHRSNRGEKILAPLSKVAYMPTKVFLDSIYE